MNSRSRSSAFQANAVSSSSLGQRQSSRQSKRDRNESDDDEEEEIQIVTSHSNNTSSNMMARSSLSQSVASHPDDKFLYHEFKMDKQYITYEMKVSEKDKTNWNKLNVDAQNLCIKRLVRYILFRSSKKETITRDKLADVLNAIDTTYKKVLNPCLQKVTTILRNDFGYDLILESDIIGLEHSKLS